MSLTIQLFTEDTRRGENGQISHLSAQLCPDTLSFRLNGLLGLLNQLLRLLLRLLTSARDKLFGALASTRNDSLCLSPRLSENFFVPRLGLGKFALHPLRCLQPLADPLLPLIDHARDRPEREAPKHREKEQEGDELDE